MRDKEWDAKLDKFIAYLPSLQAGLPVSAEYKPDLNAVVESTGNGAVEAQINEPGFPPMDGTQKPLSQLAVFDVVYYGGDCNSGSKTIAVNLPNDERIQKNFGTRRSQLKIPCKRNLRIWLYQFLNELYCHRSKNTSLLMRFSRM